jgi:molybdate transport system substrate-binding protein
VVLAGPTVPLGRASAKALTAAGVSVKPLSFEDSAAGVVGKVRLGEADAGIAYLTDVVASGASLHGVPLAGSTTDLAIGTLNSRSEAAAFVEFVRSAEGRSLLVAFGFT